MPHFMIIFISFKTFLDNKMSFFFEEYGAFNKVGKITGRIAHLRGMI